MSDDIKSFETKVQMRSLRIEDFDELVAMQQLCFPGMHPWERDQIESQLAIFSEGQLVIESDGRIVASCSTLIINSDDHEDWHNWGAIASGGYITGHDPEGDVLYGIELMVHPEFRGMRLARRLYDARKEIARQYNLQSIIIGGRIPGYATYADEMSAREYVERVSGRKLYDPVLTAQLANGFVIRRLIPGYFPSDDASRGYATYLEWTNLDWVHKSNKKHFTVDPVRIGVVQYEMRPISSFEDMATQIEFFVDAAADKKSDFILFPELITTQLMSLAPSLGTREGALRIAHEYTEPYLELLTALAVKYNINIVGGTHFIAEEDNLFNAACLARRDGTLELQKKLHSTPEEKRWYGLSGGDKVRVLQTDRGKVAIFVCYDIEFPELARIAVHEGAQILFVPFNTPDRNGYLRVRHCAHARCIENSVYVAMAGCSGNLPFVKNADIHYAQSAILTPLDVAFAREGVAAETTPNSETVLLQDLDLELLRRNRQRGTVTHWLDRREDLYAIHYQRDGKDLSV